MNLFRSHGSLRNFDCNILNEIRQFFLIKYVFLFLKSGHSLSIFLTFFSCAHKYSCLRQRMHATQKNRGHWHYKIHVSSGIDSKKIRQRGCVTILSKTGIGLVHCSRSVIVQLMSEIQTSPHFGQLVCLPCTEHSDLRHCLKPQRIH